MSDLLKGNYKVDVEIEDKKQKKSSDYEDQAINSIGGSMVFVEREKLTWKGRKKNSMKTENE